MLLLLSNERVRTDFISRALHHHRLPSYPREKCDPRKEEVFGENVQKSHGTQNFVARITCHFFDFFEVGEQGGLVFEEAVGYQVEASVRFQYLRGLADEARSDGRGLNAALVKRWVGYDQIEALVENGLCPVAG